MKKANVVRQTTITQGRKSLSRFHFLNETANEKADINHAQKTNDPD